MAKSPKTFNYDPKLDIKIQFERMYRILREDIVENETKIENHESRIVILEP
jgi:hypothetical protein